MKSAQQLAASLALSLFCVGTALAIEYPIGVPQHKAGMELAAVYLQAVEMEPDGMMRKAA